MHENCNVHVVAAQIRIPVRVANLDYTSRMYSSDGTIAFQRNSRNLSKIICQ